jgi:uncharacterized Zn-binding protein involved in type VI secretion
MNRPLLYGRAQIVVGDITSHGGVVVSGSPSSSWHGIPIVRKTDKVTCPKCKPHIFEVAEGLETCTDTDAMLLHAVEGHRTTCGAVLIAKSAGAYSLAKALNPEKKFIYDEQFLLKDSTGKPLVGMYYTAKLPDGELIHGVTDASGKTERFGSDNVQNIKLHIGHIENQEASHE